MPQQRSREAAPLITTAPDGRKLSQFDVWLQPSSGDRAAGTMQPAFPRSSQQWQHPTARLSARPLRPLPRADGQEVGDSQSHPRTAAVPPLDVCAPAWEELAGPHATLPAKREREARTGFFSGSSSNYL